MAAYLLPWSFRVAGFEAVLTEAGRNTASHSPILLRRRAMKVHGA